MDEYIERETAIREIRAVYEYDYPTASGEFDKFATKVVPDILRTIPTADIDRPTKSQFKRMAAQMDYAPVVRCKDCKYWYTDDWQVVGGVLRTAKGERYTRCQMHNYYDEVSKTHMGWCPTENDYCSCGIRKEEDTP